jgi:hypothetical protein
MTSSPSSPFNVSAAKAAKLLPPLPSIPCPGHKGPTDWSNWVIKGRLLAGAFPASPDDADTEATLTRLLELGVNTFVCLQAEVNLEAAEADWRGNRALRPYIYDAQKILVRARKSNNPCITQVGCW